MARAGSLRMNYIVSVTVLLVRSHYWWP